MVTTGVLASRSAVRFGPAVLSALSALFCSIVNPTTEATEWSNLPSIATGISFGLALALSEVLWGRGRWLAVLIPAATLIGWIAAWWTTISVGGYAGEFVGSFFGEGSNEIVAQVSGGFAGGAVGALLTAPSVATLRRWTRLGMTTGLGAVLGTALVIDLQYHLQVLYFVWQIGFALHAGYCLILDRAVQGAG